MTVKTLGVWMEDHDGVRYTGTWRYRTEHVEIIVHPVTGSVGYFVTCERLRMTRINLCAREPDEAKKAALSTVRAFVGLLARELGADALIAFAGKGAKKR